MARLKASKGFGAALRPFIPILVVLSVLFYAPLTFFLLVSFWRYSPQRLFVPQWTLANYVTVLTDPTYRLALSNTLRLGLSVAVVAVAVGYAFAFVLWRSTPRWRGLLMTAIIAPLFVSVVIRTYGWLVILDNSGPLNELLRLLHLPATNIQNTLMAVLISLVEVELPFATLPIYAALTEIDHALTDAAATLGEGPFRTFVRVILPLSLPGVVTGGVLVFSMAASAFVEPLILGQANLFLLSTLGYADITQILNWPLGSAAGFFLLAVAMVTTVAVVGVLRLTRAGRVV